MQVSLISHTRRGIDIAGHLIPDSVRSVSGWFSFFFLWSVHSDDHEENQLCLEHVLISL